MTKCKSCKGTGELFLGHNLRWDTDDYITCTSCEGLGEVSDDYKYQVYPEIVQLQPVPSR
jgi:DnaJ-class molecular chaperone